MHISRNYILLSILFISSIFPVFAQGVSMSPTRLFFSGNPGETVSKPVTLRNSSHKDYVFNIHLKDWHREEDGNKVYFQPESLPNSNAAWISTQESTVSLPAKGNIEIMVHMKIPEDASSSEVTNSMLFFTEIGKQEDQAQQQMGIGIITLIEFGLHVYHTPPENNIQSLEIMNIEEVEKEDKQQKTIAVEITNDGNKVSDATVELELTNTETGEEIKLKPINISMMPKADQTVKFTIPTNLKGTYLGVTIIKIAGTNDLSVGEKTFEF
ncbi:MAG TPA: hypothetical protein VK021_12640 [Flavobacteriaceae bacterium]|nr:hypothetical protein [Flavobacteriaceae bacterium]